MTSIFGAIRGLVVLAGLLLPASSFAQDLKSDGQSAADRWDQTYNKGDMDALGKLYATDAQVVPKGAAISGRDNIQKFFAGLKAKGFDDHKITVQSAANKGATLILTGRWEMNGPGEGGAKKKYEGNWINVLERQNDGWQSVLHTWN